MTRVVPVHFLDITVTRVVSFLIFCSGSMSSVQ
jgi:hypothetical protein